jgi:hypothetical protein
MNFPRFWARANRDGFVAWGWSNESLDAAKALGMEVARRIADRIQRGDRKHIARYTYGDRPLREEIIREFCDNGGTPRALITRNAYGCLVLNTAKLLFVDVDLGEPPERGGVLNRWLGSEKRVAEHSAKQQVVMDRAIAWARNNPGWCWRIYETRAGIRLAASHRGFDPVDPICTSVFEWMNADPLYRRLCANQKCFRARLTPKPWRCGHAPPRERWPFLDNRRAQQFEKWQEDYILSARDYSTCRLMHQTDSNVAFELSDLIAVHDELARVSSGLPLA